MLLSLASLPKSSYFLLFIALDKSRNVKLLHFVCSSCKSLSVKFFLLFVAPASKSMSVCLWVSFLLIPALCKSINVKLFHFVCSACKCLWVSSSSLLFFVSACKSLNAKLFLFISSASKSLSDKLFSFVSSACKSLSD